MLGPARPGPLSPRSLPLLLPSVPIETTRRFIWTNCAIGFVIVSLH